MAYVSKIYSALDTEQGNAVVATSPNTFKTLDTDFPDGVTFAAISGQWDNRWDNPRYYSGDTPD